MTVPTLWILLCSLCFLPWDSGQLQTVSLELELGLECESDRDCSHIESSSCVEGYCECDPGYQYDVSHDYIVTCSRCPGIRDTCLYDCCFPPGVTECRHNVCRCANQNSTSTDTCSDPMDSFKLATQIALGSALVLALLCLVALLWKSCKRRREIARRAAGNSGAVSGASHVGRRRLRVPRRSSSQNSLSSGQLRVVELLRDRPPGYHDRTHIRIEKPPTYEETLEQPQLFPIITIDGATSLSAQYLAATSAAAETPEDSLPSYEMAACGVDNAAFVIADEKSAECDRRVSSETAELHM